LVISGEWRGGKVVAKIYYSKRRARRDWQQERRGIDNLTAHGITTPEMLLSSAVPGTDAYISVFRRIVDGHTIRDALAQAKGEDEGQRILNKSAATFAQLHHRGLLHTDPHFDNFLFSNDTIYTLDASSIRDTHRSPVRADEATTNLCDFLVTLPLEHESYFETAVRTYCHQSNGLLEEAEIPRILALVTAKRRRKLADHLSNKIFRDCTSFVHRLRFRRRDIYDRRYDTTEFRALLQGLDQELEQRGEIALKRGRRTTIIVIRFGRDYFAVKRYRNRGVWLKIKALFRMSRAAYAWREAHRLGYYRIPTAEPIAMVENRFGPIRLSSYLMTRYVEGPHCLTYYLDTGVNDGDKHRVAERLVDIFRKLARARISHGDMKATNIIIHEGQPYLMELDAVRQHRSNDSLTAGFCRDVHRFLRNWNEDPVRQSFFRKALAAIMSCTR
jgi:tRNA A-37 threonylcarbamoyl transferase component Bud32